MTEFKWFEGIEVHKLYLSAILDLCDRRIVSYVLSEHNDNPLVYKTFDKAVKTNPDAHPLFHSDRGFQYTSRAFPVSYTHLDVYKRQVKILSDLRGGQPHSCRQFLRRNTFYAIFQKLP